MWTDTRDCVPLVDGEYIVQTVYGTVTSMNYTAEGGWNTHRTTEGVLSNENAIEDAYVVRWYDVPKPKKVPKKWLTEYMERR